MLRAEEEIMAEPKAVRVEAPVREASHMSARGGEIDGMDLPLPGTHEVQGGGGERVVPAHGAAEVRMIVVGRLARRHEGELRELHDVVAARVGLGQALDERL